MLGFDCIFKYLNSNKNKLSKRKDSRKLYATGKNWYKIVRPGRFTYINPPKLLIQGIERFAKIGYLESNSTFSGANCPGFIQKENNNDLNFFLGLLNTNIITYYLRSICPPKLSNYFRFNTTNLNTIPIPRDIDDDIKKEMINEVTKLKKILLSNKHNEKNIQELILSINKIGYEIYQIDKTTKNSLEESIKIK